MMEVFAPRWSLQNVLGCNCGHTEDHLKPSIDFDRARILSNLLVQTSMLAHCC